MSKNNVGLFDKKLGKYIPFTGDRIAKPTPYNTDGNHEAYRQWLELSAGNPGIVLQRMSKTDLDRIKAGGLG